MNITLSSTFWAYSREKADVFSDPTKLQRWLLGGHRLMEAFQISRDFNLAQGLAIHTRFDDLDLISNLQICQNHKLPTDIRFLSSVI